MDEPICPLVGSKCIRERCMAYKPHWIDHGPIEPPREGPWCQAMNIWIDDPETLEDPDFETK